MTEFDPTAIGALGLLIPAVVLLIVVLYLVPFPLWIAAWSSGAYVGLLTLVGHAAPARAAGDDRQRPDQRGQGRAADFDRRPRSAFPGGRQRRARRQRADLGGQGQHRDAVQARGGDRPGRS